MRCPWYFSSILYIPVVRNFGLLRYCAVLVHFAVNMTLKNVYLNSVVPMYKEDWYGLESKWTQNQETPMDVFTKRFILGKIEKNKKVKTKKIWLREVGRLRAEGWLNREDSLRKTESNDIRFWVRLWREHELALPNKMECSGTGVKFEVAFEVRVMSWSMPGVQAALRAKYFDVHVMLSSGTPCRLQITLCPSLVHNEPRGTFWTHTIENFIALSLGSPAAVVFHHPFVFLLILLPVLPGIWPVFGGWRNI